MPVVEPHRPAWRRYLFPGSLVGGAALAGYLISWIVVPAPMPGHVVVPALRGIPQTEAEERLASIGLRLRLGEELADPNVPDGLVAWQSPVAETQLPKGSLVLVGLSSGAPAVAVPDLQDFDLSLATRVLAAGGLKVGAIDSVDVPGDAGIVVSTAPDAGSPIRPGGAVALTLSRGTSLVPVPVLTGLTIREARSRLTSLGLHAGSFTQRAEGRSGSILAQDPLPGTMLPKGSKVDMTISGANP